MPILLFPNPLHYNLTDKRLWFRQNGCQPHYAVIDTEFTSVGGFEDEISLSGQQGLQILHR